MPRAGGSPTGNSPRRRIRIRVEGIVQGVGFRPYLYRLAVRLGLAGRIWNDPHGVQVEIEGAPAWVAEFLARLESEAPPLARVERVTVEEVAPLGEVGVWIGESVAGAVPDEPLQTTSSAAAGSATPFTPVPSATALIPPDQATCAACLAELFDPADRRYRYPFINCTDCGPRYTIIRGLPYDRPQTTMSGFALCARCRAEYHDPADRRFHAQPNACPECGPKVWVVEGGAAAQSDGTGGEVRDGRGAVAGAVDPILAVCAALRAGAIVAIKGLGGFHVACLARDAAAVRTLRERKRRPVKPFALMVPDLAAARALVELDPVEEALLCGPERPIVLARRRELAGEVAGDVVLDSASRGADLRRGGLSPGVAAEVAPGQRELGVMLPYTPLHHLILAEVGEPLVMTSGNRSDEPIAFRNDEALARLAGIADLFLLHDRPIQVPIDDSVARVITVAGERRVQLIRRARGYAPLPLRLPVSAERPILACGAELKNTFCLAYGGRGWLSQHVGDLEEYETLRVFEAGIAHLEVLTGISPAVVAHDLHPEFRSTRYALERVAAAIEYGGRDVASPMEQGRPGVDWGGRMGAEPTPIESLAVQHHHAHLAACLAEHGECGPALGVIFDGTGYGPDGVVWGGEFLVGDLVDYKRVGHLHPVRLPGGEAAIREPWRMACAWLVAAGVGEVAMEEAANGAAATGVEMNGVAATGDAGRFVVPRIPATLAEGVDPEWWRAVARLASSGIASPLTTSMGRLFDAVGALCGLGTRASYEGELAIALEGVIDRAETGWYEVKWGGAAMGVRRVKRLESPGNLQNSGSSGSSESSGRAGDPEGTTNARDAQDDRGTNGAESITTKPRTPPLVLDPRPLIRAVVADLELGASVGVIAARFHRGLIRATTSASIELATRYAVGTVVLSGGVFQNRELLEGVVAELARSGLRILTPSLVPPNDGGISFGQAAIAAARGSAGAVRSSSLAGEAAPVGGVHGP